MKPIECLHYALNQPTSVVITGIDKPEVLDQAFQAAKTFKPMDDQQLTALLDKTKDAAMNGKYELFKSTAHFDSTARHPGLAGLRFPSSAENLLLNCQDKGNSAAFRFQNIYTESVL